MSSTAVSYFRYPTYDVLTTSISVLLLSQALLSNGQVQPSGTNVPGGGRSKSKSHTSPIGGLVAGGIMGLFMIVAVMIVIWKRRKSRGEGVQLIYDDLHCSTLNRSSEAPPPASAGPASVEPLFPNGLRTEGGEYFLSPFWVTTRLWSSLSPLAFVNRVLLLQLRRICPNPETERERQESWRIHRTPLNALSTETGVLSDMTVAGRSCWNSPVQTQDAFRPRTTTLGTTTGMLLATKVEDK